MSTLKQDRPDELDGAAPPVEPAPPRRQRVLGDERLPALERGRRREEDRPDEEHQGVDPEPTSSTNPGSAPTVKHAAPIANSTAIHHEIRRGDHQARSGPSPTARSCARGRDSAFIHTG